MLNRLSPWIAFRTAVVIVSPARQQILEHDGGRHTRISTNKTATIRKTASFFARSNNKLHRCFELQVPCCQASGRNSYAVQTAMLELPRLNFALVAMSGCCSAQPLVAANSHDVRCPRATKTAAANLVSYLERNGSQLLRAFFSSKGAISSCPPLSFSASSLIDCVMADLGAALINGLPLLRHSETTL